MVWHYSDGADNSMGGMQYINLPTFTAMSPKKLKFLPEIKCDLKKGCFLLVYAETSRPEFTPKKKEKPNKSFIMISTKFL